MNSARAAGAAIGSESIMKYECVIVNCNEFDDDSGGGDSWGWRWIRDLE
jgi:hypothetical protein